MRSPRARTILSGRSEERGEEAARSLQAEGLAAEFRRCDVADFESVSALLGGAGAKRRGQKGVRRKGPVYGEERQLVREFHKQLFFNIVIEIIILIFRDLSLRRS